jgi:hypothetical protein
MPSARQVAAQRAAAESIRKRHERDSAALLSCGLQPGSAAFCGGATLLALLVAGGGWVEHLAPPIWPSRARYLVACGAFLLAVGAVPALRATSDFPLADVAFAFRFLPPR